MEQHILGISGAKQSGKTTCAKFIHGYQMKLHDVIEKFMMNEKGDLIVNSLVLDEDGNPQEALGIFEVEGRDPEYIEYCHSMVWPYVRAFSFAEPLKLISMMLFGLTEEQCFGTDEEKNSSTKITWKRMPGLKEKRKGFMSAREFLQYFGTNICRIVKNDVWVEACINSIKSSGTQLAIVPDVRFDNEVQAIQEAGGKVIRLTRKPHEDAHASETALDNYKDFDCVIDNSSLDIHETNMELLKILKEWRWLKTKN